MIMKAILAFGVITLYVTAVTEACSLTEDYRTLKAKDVLGNIDLVVLGRFHSQENTTETNNGRTDYVLTLNTEVDCIMKNENGVSVDRNIKISEIRSDSWDTVIPCVDNFHDIRFNTHVAIGITPHKNRTSEWEFEGYNLQGPYFYWVGENMVDVDKLTWVCGFQSPVEPTGGNCPDVTLPQGQSCQEALTAGVGRPIVKTVMMLAIVSLLQML